MWHAHPARDFRDARATLQTGAESILLRRKHPPPNETNKRGGTINDFARGGLKDDEDE
jgi:hypothetical protein